MCMLNKLELPSKRNYRPYMLTFCADFDDAEGTVKKPWNLLDSFTRSLHSCSNVSYSQWSKYK